MALSAGYVARETGGNLRRNLLLSMAAMVAMAVSLTVLGSVLVARQAINKAAVQWKGGVELAIFMQPSVTGTETDAIGHELQSTPGVKTYHFVDKPQAYREFKTIFGGNNDIVNALGVNDMPPSYRVVPTRVQDTAELAKQFEGQPGVLQVSFAGQQIKAAEHRSNQMKLYGGIGAGVMLIVAVALIVVTLQLAIFSRRREVAVMKLVGATNWFIRIPFMLEGCLEGLVGAAIAFGITYAVRQPVASFVGNESFPLGIQSVYVTPTEALLSGLVLLAIGGAVGVLGSAFAVRRFLAV
jgi:cell division transport system permease protein